MSAAKRVRWECPHGLHAGELGSTRPRKNATVRFCWACSQEAGVLVERVAPALERKRSARAAVTEQRRETAAARRREEKEREFKVVALDYLGAEIELDVRELLKTAWRSTAIREALGDTYSKPGRIAPPELTIRRGTERMNRARQDRSEARMRDRVSGHAYSHVGPITLTIGPGCGREWIEAIVAHEAAHSALPHRESHGPRWRRLYAHTVRDLHAVTVGAFVAPQVWRMDELVAQAIREKGMVT